MDSNTEVANFLQNLKEKLKCFVPDVVFRPRSKNNETLIKLNITPDKRKKYLSNLKVEDYISGPNVDTFDPSKPKYYEFGLSIRNEEIYIKINLGKPNKPIDCMSFHIAEKKINYPFKKE